MKKHGDEYEEVYEISNKGGCGFYLNKGNVSKSYILNQEDLNDIPDQCIGDDNVTVICKPCGCFMRFNNASDKMFVCGICGIKVYHMTLINKLLKEIEKENSKYEDYEEYYD